jgi:hypothetical protein
MAKKKRSYRAKKKELASIVRRLTNVFAPGDIQAALAKQYEDLSLVSKTEAEEEFWFKCFRASQNLSSGMHKWGHEMIDDLEGE